MSALLSEARREVLGFFRRLDSFWLLAGFGADGATPLAFLAFGPVIAGPGVSEAFGLNETRFAAEIAHNYASVLALLDQQFDSLGFGRHQHCRIDRPGSSGS